MRVSPESMTQETRAIGQFAQSVAQVGGTMSEIGIAFENKLREAREASEYAGAENAWKEGINQFKLGLDTDTDYKTYSERFEGYQSQLYNKITPTITEKNAQGAFKRFTDEDLVGERFAVSHRANQTEMNFMKADYHKNIELAVKRGDTDFINKATTAAVAAGYIKADAGETARQNALKKVEYETAWQTAISMPDAESATELIEQTKGLSPGERNSLLTAVNRHFTAEEARQKEAVEKGREAQRENLLPKMRDGSITPDDIYNAGFDTGEEKQWFGWMDSRNKAIASGKTDPLTETNDAVYGNMSERINLYPDTVDKADIWALHGKGLSTSDCEKLTKTHEGNEKDSAKAQALKRGHSTLNTYKNDGLFGDDTQESEKVWGQKSNALDQYSADHPDASNEDITTFLEGLVSEEKSNYFGGILDAYWRNLTFGLAGGINEMFPAKGEYEKTATNPKTGDKMGWDGEKWQTID